MKKILYHITAILLIFSFSVCYAAEINFTDVKSDDWFYKNLQELTEKNIASGYPDGTFKPGNTLKFEEFIKMLVVAVEEELEEQKEGQEWYQIYIDKAIEGKYITEQQKSLIGQNISRGTMAEILYSVLTEKEEITAYTDAELQYLSDRLTDVEKTDVKILNINGIGVISGYPDGAFQPVGTLTRAEAVAVISRVINPELRNPVKIVKRDASGIIDANDLEKVPIEQTNYEWLKKRITYNFDNSINYKVENVIKADASMFPIRYGNLVITGAEILSAEKSPFSNGERGGIILHAYAYNSNGSSGRFLGKYVEGGLAVSILEKSGEDYIGGLANCSEKHPESNKIKEMFPNYAFSSGDPLWTETRELNQLFTVNFTIGDKKIENIDKIIFMDEWNSTKDVIEIDAKDVKKIK